MTEWVNADGTVSWMKKKHESLKTKGRYAGGEKADKSGHHKRNKKGTKSYVYGSWVLLMQPSGKKVMRKVN